MDLYSKIEDKIKTLGVSDWGFFTTDRFGGKYKNGISIVVQLSDGIIDEIVDAPTHSYFHHYRTVNAQLDRFLFEIGDTLHRLGYSYIPVPASQSINGLQGRFSHKEAACLAGLGGLGKNGLFLHKKLGPRVRLGTIFTDAPIEVKDTFKQPSISCIQCNRCVSSCPAMAIPAESPVILPDSSIIDRAACSAYMKKHFKHIGRGAVCGICIKVCPMNNTGTATKGDIL